MFTGATFEEEVEVDSKGEKASEKQSEKESFGRELCVLPNPYPRSLEREGREGLEREGGSKPRPGPTSGVGKLEYPTDLY